MTYPHKIELTEHENVSVKTIQVKITTDIAGCESYKTLIAEPKEFLEFWKPLVEYYGELKNASNIQ